MVDSVGGCWVAGIWLVGGVVSCASAVPNAIAVAKVVRASVRVVFMGAPPGTVQRVETGGGPSWPRTGRAHHRRASEDVVTWPVLHHAWLTNALRCARPPLRARPGDVTRTRACRSVAPLLLAGFTVVVPVHLRIG